eukprot:Gb_21974 [translate_table: standard]
MHNWNSNHAFCNWMGVACNSRTQRVVSINLPGMALQGSISPLLANLSFLKFLDLSNNTLNGHIPPQLRRLYRLRVLQLDSIQLQGFIPIELGELTQLEMLYIYENQLIGPIPNSLSNCSSLSELVLDQNELGGHIPIINLSATPAITYPFLQRSPIALTYKRYTSFHNEWIGVLPLSIGILSSNLSMLSFASNHIEGKIPQQIGNLTNLIFLNLSENLFSGTIPSELKGLQKLERLFLANNKLDGGIPSEIGELKYLGLLDLGQNMLSGSIPDSLERLSQLRKLVLDRNQLSGNIPASLGNCRNLELLDLSYNRFTGTIPPEVTGLPNLQFYLNLSNNALQGSIPPEIGKMEMVQAIDMSANKLNRSRSFGKLRLLQDLDLSYNNMTGEVPEGGILANLDCASFIGNSSFCGPRKYSLPPCPTLERHRNHEGVIIPVTIISAFTMCCLLLGFLCRCVLPRQKLNLSKAIAIRLGHPRISYQELVNATNGFSEINLLEIGSFGSVYKGILGDGSVAAIKVLNLQNEAAHKNFVTECRVLGRVRHRNLVRIKTSFSDLSFKALVLQFMSNGSLEKHLYPHDHYHAGAEESSDIGDECELSLRKRVDIAIDIAHGMAYLHHHCFVQVVHCDLKPSNILLDDNMIAHVSDFGIAHLTFAASADSITSTIALKGSVGYIVPVWDGWKGFDKGRCVQLWDCVVGNVDEKEADPQHVCGRTKPAQVAHKTGLLCTKESPRERPTMVDVVGILESIRRMYFELAPRASRLTSTISSLACKISDRLSNLSEDSSLHGLPVSAQVCITLSDSLYMAGLSHAVYPTHDFMEGIYALINF